MIDIHYWPQIVVLVYLTFRTGAWVSYYTSLANTWNAIGGIAGSILHAALWIAVLSAGGFFK